MSEIPARHLVIVRHGESEGDVRREAFRRGEAFTATKTVDEEELTLRGVEQSRLAGLWIKEHVIARYGLERFSAHFTSLTYRSAQSAIAMDISDVWQGDDDLTERDRGLIKGWRREQHQAEYPDSYAAMVSDPIHWTPPGGESILDVAVRVERFLKNVNGMRAVLAVAHRDSIWAAQMPLWGLTDTELAAVNTDEFGNSQIIHLTDTNPETGRREQDFTWMRSVCPWQDLSNPGTWVQAPYSDIARIAA